MKQKIREQVGLISSLNRVQSVLFMHCGSCIVSHSFEVCI